MIRKVDSEAQQEDRALFVEVAVESVDAVDHESILLSGI